MATDFTRLTFVDYTTPVVSAAWLNGMQAKADLVISASDYGALADGTDQTAAVQAACDALTTSGNEIVIPRGTKFDLSALTFPIRANLRFWMDDDLSRPNPITTLGTNEQVLFAANANNDGIVNEWRNTAAFHPGVGVDVRRDIAGHDAYLGSGQVRAPTDSAPARASINIWDSQNSVFNILYETYGGTLSRFNTTGINTFRTTVQLNGVTTGSWSTVPAVGEIITGSTSGAYGWFLSSDGSSTTVLWGGGVFESGETLTDSDETTAATITTTATAIVKNQILNQNHYTGTWNVGCWPLTPAGTFNVGGKIVAMPTKSVGQYIHSAVTNPAFVLADMPSYDPANGFEITYNVAPAAASRRVTLRTLAGSTDKAHIGAVTAHGAFNDAGTISTSAYNFDSITKNATGDYTVNFTNAMARADFSVTVSTESPTIYAYVFAYTTSSVRIKVVSTADFTTATNISGVLHVNCMGGDI